MARLPHLAASAPGSAPLPLPLPLPPARGPLTEALRHRLLQPAGPGRVAPWPDPQDDPLDGEDSALALYCCYELHYGSFDRVDDAWEWDPELLAWRARLERAFLGRLRDELADEVPTDDAQAAIRWLATRPGPSLSRFVEADGTFAQLREFAVHRSAYQLKEADPHTWGIPRMAPRAKAALVAIQRDEYGDGVPGALHSDLFAATLRALGLDDRPGAHLDRIPGVTLATVNLVSMFGLHRRWRGALAGHLALFEATSVAPMRRYARALRRVGAPAAAPFYDAHVDADVGHELVALDDLCGALLEADPHLAGDVVFGARALDLVEARFARHLLRAWSEGTSSLRPGHELPAVEAHAPARAAGASA